MYYLSWRPFSFLSPSSCSLSIHKPTVLTEAHRQSCCTFLHRALTGLPFGQHSTVARHGPNPGVCAGGTCGTGVILLTVAVACAPYLCPFRWHCFFVQSDWRKPLSSNESAGKLKLYPQLSAELEVKADNDEGVRSSLAQHCDVCLCVQRSHFATYCLSERDHIRTPVNSAIRCFCWRFGTVF